MTHAEAWEHINIGHTVVDSNTHVYAWGPRHVLKTIDNSFSPKVFEITTFQEFVTGSLPPFKLVHVQRNQGQDLAGVGQALSSIPTDLLATQNKGCSHSWKTYQGFSDSFDYCEKCDIKKKDVVEPLVAAIGVINELFGSDHSAIQKDLYLPITPVDKYYISKGIKPSLAEGEQLEFDFGDEDDN